MFIVFSLYCLVALSVTLIQMVQEYRHTQETITQEMQSYEKIFGPILSKALWDLDRDRMNEIVMGMSQIPILVGIKVERIKKDALVLVDHAGLTSGIDSSRLGNDSKDTEVKSYDLFSYRFPVTYQIMDESKQLGFVTLYSNSSVIFDRVELGFLFLLINAIIKGAALWLIFLWVSKYILLKPLTRLTHAITDLNFDNLSNFKIDLKTQQDNELTVIEKAVSKMVSELDSAKHEVLEFNQKLEEQVTLRTSELVKAKIFAEKSASAKSEFLAKMSHEIRTPMNGVVGMLHLLLKEGLSESQQKKAIIAESSALSLLKVINDILDFSKIDANKLALDIVDLSLVKLFEDVTDSFAYQAEEKGLELRLDLSEIKQDWVKGDPTRIRQVLTNLVSNAVKFTSEGFISIKAKLSQHKDGQLVLTCSVEDSGIGIPANQIDALFESFAQVDSSITRKYGGTGLGLTIVKKLCELMDGEIYVESQEGIGSRFECKIPLKQSDVTPESIEKEEQKAEQEISTEFALPVGTRILLVEDNRINQLVAQNLLETMGLESVLANDGCEALEVLNATPEENAFSLILMDCQMPNMDGFEATRAIRSGQAGSHYQNVSIIALTANAMKGDREECIEQGMNDYISKPIDPERLQEILKKWLVLE